MEELEPSYFACGTAEWCNYLKKVVHSPSYKVNIEFFCDLEILPPGVYPKDVKAGASNKNLQRNVYSSISHDSLLRLPINIHKLIWINIHKLMNG